MSQVELKPSLPGEPTSVRWLVFVLACAISWILYLHRYTFNFIKEPLAKEMDWNNTQISAVYSLFNYTYGFGQLPSGFLCDFAGTHWFLATIIIFWSLMLAAFGLSPGYLSMSASRLLFGAGQAGTYPILAKVIRTWFPRASRTTLQGMVATFSGRMGGAMSSVVMATILMGMCGLSWRMALVVMGAAGILFGLAFLLLFRESPHSDPRVNEAERHLIADGEIPTPMTRVVLPIGKAICNRSLLAIMCQQFLAAGADNVYQYLMGSFFLLRYKVELGAAGLLVSMPLVGGALGGLAAGWLNDASCRRFGIGRGRAMVGFAGPLFASIVMFAVIQQETALAAGVALLCVKFFVDWTQPTVWGACTDIAGRYTASVFSIVNTAGTLGGVVFPLLFGYILDANSTKGIVDGKEVTTHINFTPLFLTIAGMYVLGAVCWFFVNSEEGVDVKA